MTLTRYPLSNIDANTNYNTPDLAILNVSRLFARLEHNLLAPTANLKSLRRSEYQRMRVGAVRLPSFFFFNRRYFCLPFVFFFFLFCALIHANEHIHQLILTADRRIQNIEYARTTLLSLEKSLPGIKPVDRRHEIQTDVTRKRQVLKLLQGVLEEVTAQAVGDEEDDDDDDDDFEEGGVALDDEGEKGIYTPEGSSEQDEQQQQQQEPSQQGEREEQGEQNVESPSSPTTTKREETTTTTVTPPTSTLRNRHHQFQPTAPPTSIHTHAPEPVPTPTTPNQTQTQTTEQALSSNRLEQETLTDSLLSLATQLKSSSTAFHTSLESEKSVLDRAVDGLDATTSNMGAAEKRMGMLRKMTEGKGWWGRMMLYAWILGLWVVAILIVFLGPKLRF